MGELGAGEENKDGFLFCAGREHALFSTLPPFYVSPSLPHPFLISFFVIHITPT